MRSSGPTHWLHYYDTHAILCAGYNELESKLPDALHSTLLCALWHILLIALDCTLPACLTVPPNCSRWHTPSLLDLCSQVSSQDAPNYSPSTLSSTLPIALDDTLPACFTIRFQVSSQDAPKYTPSTLLSTPPSMFSNTLSGMLSRTLPIALDGTLPACLTVRSQVSSQDALNHTPEHAFKYTPNCTRWHTASLLDYTLPSKLSRRSQSHSRARSQVHSQLHSMTPCQPARLYAPKCSQDALNHTPEHALKYTTNCTRWHTPSLLDYTLPSRLPSTLQVRSQVHLRVCSQVHSRACSPGRSQLRSMAHSQPTWLRSQVSSQDTPKNPSEYAPKYTSQSLANTLSRRKTLPISLDYMLPCMLLHARSRDLQSCRRQALRGVRLVAYGKHTLADGGLRVACGVWQVAGGRRCMLADIMTSVDMVVWILSSARVKISFMLIFWLWLRSDTSSARCSVSGWALIVPQPHWQG